MDELSPPLPTVPESGPEVKTVPKTDPTPSWTERNRNRTET
jgi:hypothetical protein